MALASRDARVNERDKALASDVVAELVGGSWKPTRCSKVALATAARIVGSVIGSIAASACPALRGRVSYFSIPTGSWPPRLTRTMAWPLVWARRLPAAKVQANPADALGDNLVAGLQHDIEVWQYDLSRAAERRVGVATTSKLTFETIWSPVSLHVERRW